MLTTAVKTGLSIQALRLAVAHDLRQNGDMTHIGYDNIESVEPETALNWPAAGTIFELIGGSLTKHGAPKEGGYNTLGDVMSGLGYDDQEEAHEAAHWIGCHCHGIITGNIVADRLEGLNTE